MRGQIKYNVEEGISFCQIAKEFFHTNNSR